MSTKFKRKYCFIGELQIEGEKNPLIHVHLMRTVLQIAETVSIYLRAEVDVFEQVSKAIDHILRATSRFSGIFGLTLS